MESEVVNNCVIIQLSTKDYHWTPYKGDRDVKSDMVKVGRDTDNAVLVVAKAYHSGDVIPGKAKPEQGVAYVSYDGGEHIKKDFEVLMMNNYKWDKAQKGEFPKKAVKGGRTASDEILYIGRTDFNGVTCVGKVHPSHGRLYYPYGGQERSTMEYDVLVEK